MAQTPKQQKAYYQKNLEKKREYARNRYHSNREAIKASKRNLYKRNRESVLLERRERCREYPSLVLWEKAGTRARRNGVPFNIDVCDVVIPEVCPVLGITLKSGDKGFALDSSPTIDRLIPSLGYVKGNVKVISWRANRLKSDATLEELEAIVSYVLKELHV